MDKDISRDFGLVLQDILEKVFDDDKDNMEYYLTSEIGIHPDTLEYLKLRKYY